MDTVLNVLLNSRGFVVGAKAITKASSTMRKGMRLTRGRLDGLQKQIFSFKGALAGLGLGLVSKSFLDAASTTEQLRIRMEVLLGSVSEGNRLFDEMTKFASKVPFEFEEIMQSATQLSGVMKGGVDEITQWLPLIGDLAATSGLSIQETTEQIARMYSAGAASADKFRERGISAMLGFKAGVSVSAEDTRKQLMASWNAMDSQFRGATDRLATTWSGTMSMFSDRWFAFRNDVMNAGPFQFLKASFNEILKIIDARWGDTQNLAEEIGKSIVEFFKKVVLGTAGVIDALSGPISFLMKALQSFWDGFTSLPGWVQEVGVAGAILGGVKGTAILIGTLALYDKLKNKIKELSQLQRSPLTPISQEPIEERSSLFSFAKEGGSAVSEAEKFIKKITVEMERMANITYDDNLNSMKNLKTETSGLSDEFSKLTSEQKKMVELSKEAARIIEDTQTPTDSYIAQIQRMNVLFQQGFLDVEQFTRAIKVASEELDSAIGKDIMDERSDSFNTIISNVEQFGSTLNTAMTDAVLHGADAWKTFGNTVVNELIRMINYLLIIKPLVDSLKTFIPTDVGITPGSTATVPAGPRSAATQLSGIRPTTYSATPTSNITVNYKPEINTIDSRGVADLLVQQEPVIVGIVDKAVRKRSGRRL